MRRISSIRYANNRLTVTSSARGLGSRIPSSTTRIALVAIDLIAWSGERFGLVEYTRSVNGGDERRLAAKQAMLEPPLQSVRLPTRNANDSSGNVGEANANSEEHDLTKRELDQKTAIMIVIQYVGNVAPGTKCSALFFDQERIRREKEFYAKLYSENGVHDLEILRAMVAANVPDDPYWLVSLKTGDGATAEIKRLHRVDDRTGMVLPEPA